MMAMSCYFQLCRSFRSPETAKRYTNAAIGILLIPLTELLVVPVQLGLDSAQINLPASVLVMILVSILMLCANLFHGGVDSVYRRHVKGPTDFLGRHMSFGFVASFVMLSKDHIETLEDIPRITGAFFVSSLVSYFCSFLFAAASFQLEHRLRRLRNTAHGIENNQRRWPSPLSRDTKTQSSSRPMTIIAVTNASQSSFESLCPCPPQRSIIFIVTTAPLWISLLLALWVGLPMYCVTRYEMPFETFFFLFLWIGAVLFQRWLKTYNCNTFGPRPRVKSILAILFNPVLVTSALATAYFWAKTGVTHQNIDEVLGAFRRHATWAEIVRNRDADVRIGAGDLATALLDAGIVSLGLKMFEYRRELWTSIATVFSTSLVLAVLNVFVGVLLAHAMGLPAYEALAFAARNVTIALGVPAVQNLGGSTTLMSAVVVFNGMLFQMTGDALFSWLGIRDQPLTALPAGTVIIYASDIEKDNSGDGSVGPSTSSSSGSAIAGEQRQQQVQSHHHNDDYKVIAAGVAAGINGAAMGTAHLIERDSRATAYSALSMTLFGSMTVALTAVPAISRTLISLAS